MVRRLHAQFDMVLLGVRQIAKKREKEKESKGKRCVGILHAGVQDMDHFNISNLISK